MTNTTLERLAAALGADSVRTDPEALIESSHDSWPLSTKLRRLDRHPYAADAVVQVRTETEVARVLSICSEDGVPVTVRALGSSVTGQPLPARGGVVLDVTAIPPVLQIDDVNMTVTATASYPGWLLEEELNRFGMTMGNSPQSLHRSTVGGWLATLETGHFSSLYGGIEDLVVGYRVILASGECIDLMARPRAAMGPDLRQIFLGSEGTLGVITQVTLKVFQQPKARRFEAAFLPDVSTGLDSLRQIMLAGHRPLLARLYDEAESQVVLKESRAVEPLLLLGSQGSVEKASLEMEEMLEIISQLGGRLAGPTHAKRWIETRFDFATVEDRLASRGGYAETIEVAHLWSSIGTLYTSMVAALDPIVDSVVAHFSHIYTQGTSVYFIVSGCAASDEDAVDILESVWEQAMKVCLERGAELSHHHGGGLARSPYARQALGGAHELLARVKRALDPNGVLNPGKLGL